LGTGKNTFNVLSPSESGLYLNKDVKMLSAFNTNSGANIVVAAVNSGALITLKRISNPILTVE